MPTRNRRREWIAVGLPASLTGQFQGQGKQALEGARAWVRDVNSNGGIRVGTWDAKLPIHLTYYDDCSRAQAAGDITERLIVADEVDILLGPYSSVLTMAAAPVAERLHRVLWNHGGAADPIHGQRLEWVVGILTPASLYFAGAIDLVQDRDPKVSRVGILYSARGSFPAAVAGGVERYATQQGLEVVFNRQYHPPVADFHPILRELQEAQPDVMLAVGRIQDDLLLAKHIVQMGFSAKAVGLVAAGIAQFGEELGGWAEGFMGPSQWEPTTGYIPVYGPPPEEMSDKLTLLRPGNPRRAGDYAMAQAYAAGLVAQRCIEEAGTLDNLALRDIANRLDFTTFYGRFKLDSATGRQVGRSVVIVQWQAGRKVVVWPKDARQAAVTYPFGSPSGYVPAPG